MVELESSSLDAVFMYLREEGFEEETEEDEEVKEEVKEMTAAGAKAMGMRNGQRRWFLVKKQPSGKKKYEYVKNLEDVSNLRKRQHEASIEEVRTPDSLDAIDSQPETVHPAA